MRHAPDRKPDKQAWPSFYMARLGDYTWCSVPVSVLSGVFRFFLVFLSQYFVYPIPVANRTLYTIYTYSMLGFFISGPKQWSFSSPWNRPGRLLGFSINHLISADKQNRLSIRWKTFPLFESRGVGGRSRWFAPPNLNQWFSFLHML
jgi:hypothetical protein